MSTTPVDEPTCRNEGTTCRQANQQQEQHPSSSIQQDQADDNSYLKSLYDGEDDDDFIVVSSIQERLDLLLAEDDDDIVVVRSIPSSNTHKPRNGTIGSSTYQSILVALLVVVISWHYFFRSRRQRHCLKTTKEKAKRKVKTKHDDDDDINPRMTKKCRQVLTNEMEPIADNKNKSSEEQSLLVRASSQATSPNILMSNQAPELVEDSSLLVARTIMSTKHQISSQWSGESFNRNHRPLVLEETSMKTTTTSQLEVTNTSLASSPRKDKLQIAREIAKDIKLVETVLKDEGITNIQALAAQVAVSWHSSERIIHSQRQSETRRMLLDTHNRNLDRQLSQQQHEETLQAATFDPNWKEKLQAKRDKCWMLVNRMVWESFLAYQCIPLARPLSLLIWRRHDTFSWNNLVWLALSNLCACESANIQSDTTGSLLSFYSPYWQTTNMLSYLGLDSALDTGMCYGYCLSSVLLAFLIIVTFHRGLQLLAAPAILHHLINGTALLLAYRPTFFNDNNNQLSTSQFMWQQRAVVGLSMLCIYGVVQWNYVCYENQVATCTTLRANTNFAKSLHDSLSRMDALQWKLNMFRCVMMLVIAWRVIENACVEMPLDEEADALVAIRDYRPSFS